jgi:hypothetical protein
MKRFLIPSLAIVLAVTFSAFTTKSAKQEAGTLYHWYEVANNVIISGPENPVTKMDIQDAQLIAPCENSTADPCFFGSDNPNLATDGSYNVTSRLSTDNAIYRE